MDAVLPGISFRIFPLHGILYDHDVPACTCPLGPTCKSIGKHPMVPWRNYTKNIKGPNGDYGIQTGRFNNIFVVDLEDRNSIASFYRLAAGRQVPDTFSVLTPSGGVHLYFRLPPGAHVPSSYGVLGPGIHIEGEGGYVVGPGSHGLYQKVPGTPDMARWN